MKKALLLLAAGWLVSAPAFALVTVTLTRKTDTLATLTFSGTRGTASAHSLQGVIATTAGAVTVTQVANTSNFSPGFLLAPTIGGNTGSGGVGKVTVYIGGSTGGTVSGSVDLQISGTTWSAVNSSGVIRNHLNSGDGGTWSMGAPAPAQAPVAAPVPEPEEYLLMALGLGMLGWKLRRRLPTAALLPA